VRTLGAEGCVVAMTRMHHSVIIETPEDLIFKIIHERPKVFGRGSLPRSARNKRDQGAAEINDLGPPADLISGTQNCRHCGDPIDGPPVLTAHPELPGITHKRLEECMTTAR
jgi:hypothetical protein